MRMVKMMIQIGWRFIVGASCYLGIISSTMWAREDAMSTRGHTAIALTLLASVSPDPSFGRPR